MKFPLLALPLLLIGCNENTFFIPDKGARVPEPGSVQGRVCDPSGRTWLPDAVVYTHLYNSDGELYDTRTAYSDRDGYWLLDELPQGNAYAVYIQYRTQILETHEVWVGSGDRVTLEEPDCFDPLEMDVAVITGDYDDFHLVLTNMGFANYDLIDGLTSSEIVDFLGSETALSRYDIIFFNGGHVEEDVIYDTDGTDTLGTSLAIQDNIRNYVESGGSIYASDWAYDVVETIWPTRINFVGNDDVPDDAQKGEYDLVSAAVSDAALADFLDTNFVDIEYDLPVWPPVENVEGSVSVHLTANISYRDGQANYTLPSSPILVSFSAGQGKVVFSTFRVAKNGTDDMMMALQYMMYNL